LFLPKTLLRTRRRGEPALAIAAGYQAHDKPARLPTTLPDEYW
jgi:hypothetical protein